MQRVILILSGAWTILAVLGCSPPIETSYTPRKEAGQLPEKHQKQIAAALTSYYGTPRFPRNMQPAPEDQQPAEAKEPVLVDTVDRHALQHGREVYTAQCAGCHGVTGDGQGPAAVYLNPPPRDYRAGRFKFISTPRGAKPRHIDLVRIVRHGAKGTSMPSFRWMSQDDLDDVIEYVLLLSSRGELEKRVVSDAEQDLAEEDDLDLAGVAELAQGIHGSWKDADSKIIRPLTPEPLRNADSSAQGAKAFVLLNCYKCHGRDGRGNKAHNVGKDDWGRVAFAADLTSGMLHGGRRPGDIYRRIFAGINGTPMPAFGAPNTSLNETETQRSETIWHLVHFITDIVEGKPLPMDVIDAAIVEQLKSQPVEAPAETAAPVTTEPAESKPATESAQPAPDSIKPATPKSDAEEAAVPKEAKPDEAKSEEAKPEDAKPDEAKPEDADTKEFKPE